MGTLNKSHLYLGVISKLKLTLGTFILAALHLVAGNNIDFIENKGQWNIPFESKIDIANGALFLEENALTFNFVDASSFTHQHEAKPHNDSLSAHAYRWEFLKANTPVISYSKPLEGKHNYFTNRQRVSNLKKYQKLTYNDLYDGIDYTIYTYGDGLKYDWIVHPNAKPSDIKMKLEGVDQIDLREGRLHLHTSLNLITEERPYAYQWIDNKKVDELVMIAVAVKLFLTF